MATHTDIGNGGFGRKFGISRENGANDKNGRPYFFEWIPSIPADAGKRKFETRGEGKNYELFSALDGFLTGVNVETKDFGKGPQQWLVLSMIDGDEDYRIEVGQIDGRFSMDIMKRLLDPNFDPNLRLRISPYAMEADGKWHIGLSAYCGPDGKLTSAKDSAHLAGIPQAESTVFAGKKMWDFSPVSTWLYEQVKTKVCPQLKKDPISGTTTFPTTAQAAPKYSDPFPAMEPVVMDDLPF